MESKDRERMGARLTLGVMVFYCIALAGAAVWDLLSPGKSTYPDAALATAFGLGALAVLFLLAGARWPRAILFGCVAVGLFGLFNALLYIVYEHPRIVSAFLRIFSGLILPVTYALLTRPLWQGEHDRSPS